MGSRFQVVEIRGHFTRPAGIRPKPNSERGYRSSALPGHLPGDLPDWSYGGEGGWVTAGFTVSRNTVSGVSAWGHQPGMTALAVQYTGHPVPVGKRLDDPALVVVRNTPVPHPDAIGRGGDQVIARTYTQPMATEARVD